MTAPPESRAQFPRQLEFLFQPSRYKVMYSGRGATKSWSAAQVLLILGAEVPLRVVCARETMKSIAESVHQLLEDQIKRLGYQAFYRVEKARIVGANGTEIIFLGLKHDPNAIKSLEGADIVWVEEAQNVSKASWDILVPTVRKEGVDFGRYRGDSEIWVTFNPFLDTDATYVRFVVNPPSNAKVVRLSWRDNPWFPKVLEVERQDMQRLDPVGYRNVWEGETRSSVEGAIFAAELDLAGSSGRIGKFPRDHTRPVDTAWDLGYGDKTAIWFYQCVDGWYRMIDYLEDEGRTIEWYLVQLQQKGYLYGIDWLPHDAVDTIIHKNLSSGDKTRSIEMIMRAQGRNVRVAPKLHVASRINAGRMMFPLVQFDADACYEGLRALRMYQWGPVNVNGEPRREALHDDASHGADAYQTFAVCAKQPRAPEKPKARPPAPVSAWA